MKPVGIIANPASGKDIRRLIASGTVVTNQEKINIIVRMLKAMDAVGKPDGLVKVLCDPETDELLGAHIVGHNATELLHELLLAHNSELLPEDIANMIHAHPTISEAIMETMRGVNGRPIHA